MNLNELKYEAEDKAVEYLNATRLDALEELVLNQLNKSANNGYARLHKLEFSALLQAVRGLHRKRQKLESENAHMVGQLQSLQSVNANLRESLRVFQTVIDSKIDEFKELESEKRELVGQLEELRRAISPGKQNVSPEYYIEVVRKMRNREERIVPHEG